MGVPAMGVAEGAGGLHGFPAVLTSFIGRDSAVRDVAGRLAEDRLVTVTGPGGAGKTRLAGEVAKRVAARFADGVWLAELAGVQDPDQLTAAVAAALGVRPQPGVPAAGALAEVLARQQLLLVLDNCEHVVAAASELCACLLPACDDVRILATSREPLRVAGEARYRLASLALPDPGQEDADAAGSDAVALFADRARRADARFVLDGQTVPVVARLVRILDGMPLAIELAAARVEALGVTELLDLLDDRFALLAGGDRTAPDRQRSLAAAVDWSYRLLDDEERRVFRAVSVFPGPFTLAGAQAVAGADAGTAVLRLVDCSLLVPPRPGPDGRSRYVLLETLRAYGSRLLAEAGERNAAAAALAGYAQAVAGQAAAGLATTSAEVAAALRLDAEDVTMRQVLSWAVEHDPAAAVRLAVALAPWWMLRGRLGEAYPLLLRAAGSAEPGSEGWGLAQCWLGHAAIYSADMAGALAHFTAVCDAIGDGGPSRTLTDALNGRSAVWRERGRIAEATDDGRRALGLARELGYPAGQAQGLRMLGLAAYYAGDLPGAVSLARQAGQTAGDVPGWITRACSSLLTLVLSEAGELAEAERVCAAGLAGSRDAGDLRNQMRLLGHAADLAIHAGRTADAAAHLREALQVAVRCGGWLDVLDQLDYCGFLCAATGRHAEASTVWAAYAALLRDKGHADPPATAERRRGPLRQARQALGRARADAARDRGTAMSLATAAEYALLLTAPGPSPAGAPDPGALSARERELVTLVARGRTNAQIAEQLSISVRTVGSHLDRIRDKTGCRRRADLTRLALAAGLA
jgi:predicted ATPase/DNA-binding CsgD family transcriptional regulator